MEIGKRPIFAAGNVRSGGDIAMLRYTHDVPGSFQLVINHDDAERESAYAEKDGATLAAAKAGNFSVVSMKNDWKVILSTALRRCDGHAEHAVGGVMNARPAAGSDGCGRASPRPPS